MLPFAAVLLALGVALAAFYPNQFPASGSRSQVVACVVVVVSLVGFAVGYRRLQSHGDTLPARRAILLGAVPLWVAAVLVPPFDSIDLHSYTNIGQVQVGYGANPYSTTVASIHGWDSDPLFNTWWSDTPCAYSFLFAREAAAVVRLAGPDKADILLAFKLVNVASLALMLWIVAAGCGRLGASRALGLYLVAWNPLVLLHGLSNGHNDVLSGLGLAAALYLAATRAWWLTMPLLAAVALIKYSTLPLVPIAAVFLVLRHGWVRTIASTIPAAGLAAWAAWPYLADGGALMLSRNLSNITHFVGSIGSIVVIPLRSLGHASPAWGGAEGTAANVLKLAGAALVLGVVGWLSWRRVRLDRYSWSEFVRDAVLVHFVLVLASAKFFAWYLLLFWPAVAWLPEASRLKRACLALAFAQTASVTFLSRAHVLSPLALIVAPLLWSWRETRFARGPERASIPFPDFVPPARHAA